MGGLTTVIECNVVMYLIHESFLAVEVWLEYLQFSTGLGTDKETTEKIRNLFERALTAAGLHVMKGALVWDAFREFENIIVDMVSNQTCYVHVVLLNMKLQHFNSKPVIQMDSTAPERIDQINRIGKLYRRQLACPLFGMEKTFEEYGIWRCAEGCDCTEDEKIVKSGYERAMSELDARIPFEEKLESAQDKSELLDIYKAYLMHEKQIGDPGRVTVLYERAVADLSIEPTLWEAYLHYVENNIRIDDITEKVYARVVRNVPGYVKIWQNWIRFSEKKNKPLTRVTELVQNALAVGFLAGDCKNLWVTHLEYLRRRIDEKSDDQDKRIEILRNAFNRACDHLATFNFGDPSCEILQYWARTEAIHANDMEKARSLWAEIMSHQGHSGSAASWLEYISLER